MVRCILRCFEAVSRLKMNFSKSAFVSIREVVNFDMLAANLGCSRSTYLSLGYSNQCSIQKNIYLDSGRRKA